MKGKRMRQLSEKKVLKKLGIPDFRHLTKDNVITMISMIPQMDPQVAMKALEQFPDLAKTAVELGRGYMETIKEAIESENTSLKSVYDYLNAIVSFLENELQKENLTFEEKKYILDKIIEVAKLIREAHKDHQHLILKALTAAGATALGILLIVTQVLGNNSRINDFDKPEDDDDN